MGNIGLVDSQNKSLTWAATSSSFPLEKGQLAYHNIHTLQVSFQINRENHS